MRVLLLSAFLFACVLFSSEKSKIYLDVAPSYFEYSNFSSQQGSKQRKDMTGFGVDASILKPSSQGSDFYIGLGAGAILNRVSPLVKDSYNLYHLHLLMLEYNFKYLTFNGDITIHHFGKSVPAIGKSFGGSIFFDYSKKTKLGFKFQEGRVDADPNANVEKYPISDFRYFSIIARFVF